MAQDWILAALDGHVWLDGGGKLDASSSTPGVILDTLRIPCIDEKVQDMLAGRFNLQHAAPLLRLPPELLHEILEHLNPSGAYTPAVFLFAITCKLALAVARPHIDRLQRRHFAPLAGHRLLCIANEPLTLGDHPEHLFTEDEKGALCGDSDRATDAPVYELVKKSWRRYTPDPPSFLRPMDLIHRRSTVSRMSMPDFLLFRVLAEPYYPAAATWSLRNISRREYVRLDALDEVADSKTEGPARPEAQSLRFDALLAYLCSSPPPTQTTDAGLGRYPDIATRSLRGRWAGDCLEVTMRTLPAALRGDQGQSWADLTKEVVQVVGQSPCHVQVRI
ncbi:hypothetical protein BV20DRAFT_1050434 [Pilatotrama ljubarskyi]|nr:hypothetical protein BV20DRAFT_1050434 [Pilatotrama ljubarskyi]